MGSTSSGRSTHTCFDLESDIFVGALYVTASSAGLTVVADGADDVDGMSIGVVGVPGPISTGSGGLVWNSGGVASSSAARGNPNEE